MTRRRLSRGATVLLVVIIGVVSVVLLGFVWFAAMFSGGFDNLLDLDRPKESDGKVVAAREQANKQVHEHLAVVVADIEAATGLRHSPRVKGEADWCEEGQHNWKIDDSYDLRCTVSGTVLLTGRGSEAPGQVERLVGALDRLGYRPTFPHMGLEARPGGDGVVNDDDVGSPGRYRNEGRQVEVSLLATDSPAYRIPSSLGSHGPLLVDGRPVDGTTSPSDLIRQGEYGVWLTLRLTAFEE